MRGISGYYWFKSLKNGSSCYCSNPKISSSTYGLKWAIGNVESGLIRTINDPCLDFPRQLFVIDFVCPTHGRLQSFWDLLRKLVPVNNGRKCLGLGRFGPGGYICGDGSIYDCLGSSSVSAASSLWFSLMELIHDKLFCVIGARAGLKSQMSEDSTLLDLGWGVAKIEML